MTGTGESTARFDVVGTDEDMRYAYIWLRDPDAALPSEDAARNAIVETAADDWGQQLDPTLIEPWVTQWFKDGPRGSEDEEVGCEPDDPDRRSLMWLWKIEAAMFAAEFPERAR